jgi:hypothetical protein
VALVRLVTRGRHIRDEEEGGSRDRGEDSFAHPNSSKEPTLLTGGSLSCNVCPPRFHPSSSLDRDVSSKGIAKFPFNSIV